MTTSKVGPKGQVVIPKRIRDSLGIEPGERVRVEEDDGEVRVRKLASVDELRGLLPRAEVGPGDLEEEHRGELEREERRIREWNG